MSEVTTEQLENMQRMDYKIVTVADLVANLAGLPPMMEIYLDADGLAMFLNGVEVQEQGERPPFLRLQGNVHPKPQPNVKFAETYEEQVTRKRNQALAMAHNSQEAQKMPPPVE